MTRPDGSVPALDRGSAMPAVRSSAFGDIVPRPSPELELLLCCGRARLPPDQAERIRTLVRSSIDWGRLLRLGEWHRMLPLLFWNLKKLPPGAVPDGMMAVLRRFFVENAATMLRLSGDLRGVLSLFESHGIAAIAYKGPALAAQLYGNVALRHAGDLDVVVRPDDVLRARELLIGLGYRSRHSPSPARLAFMLRSRYSEVFDRQTGQTVELHRAFTDGDVPFPIDVDNLVRYQRRIALGGGTVGTLDDSELLLVLCVHGAKHYWNRLEWVCAIAQLLERSSRIHWPSAICEAAALHSRRRLFLGLILAHELFGGPLPGEVLQQLMSDRGVLTLARDVCLQLAATEGRPPGVQRAASLPYDWLHWRVSDSAGARLRLLLYRLTTPSEAEQWNPQSLGRIALTLQRLFRPLDIGLRLIPALWWFRKHRKMQRRPDTPEPA